MKTSHLKIGDLFKISFQRNGSGETILLTGILITKTNIFILFHKNSYFNKTICSIHDFYNDKRSKFFATVIK